MSRSSSIPKATIVDDRLIRVGSTNLNNRSCGIDTECDIAIEPSQPDPTILAIRQRLIAHFLGVDEATYARREAERGSVSAGVDQLNGGRPGALTDAGPGWRARFIAEYQLGDPSSAADNLLPWRRKRLSSMLEDEVQAVLEDASEDSSKSITNGK